MDHSSCASFGCAILTHGEDGVVYGTDRSVEIDQITKPFKGDKCKSLVGKPKVFFIQACRCVVGKAPDADIVVVSFMHRGANLTLFLLLRQGNWFDGRDQRRSSSTWRQFGYCREIAGKKKGMKMNKMMMIKMMKKMINMKKMKMMKKTLSWLSWESEAYWCRWWVIHFFPRWSLIFWWPTRWFRDFSRGATRSAVPGSSKRSVNVSINTPDPWTCSNSWPESTKK